jgi:hypothetical protein
MAFSQFLHAVVERPWKVSMIPEIADNGPIICAGRSAGAKYADVWKNTKEGRKGPRFHAHYKLPRRGEKYHSRDSVGDHVFRTT